MLIAYSLFDKEQYRQEYRDAIVNLIQEDPHLLVQVIDDFSDLYGNWFLRHIIELVSIHKYSALKW